MTLISWAMLVLGFGIGFGLTCIVAIRTTKEQLKWLSEDRAMLDQVKELSIDEFRNLSEYVDKRFDSLMDFTDKLVEIVNRDHQLDRECVKELRDFMAMFEARVNNLVLGLQKNIDEHHKDEDERWFLLRDYVVSNAEFDEED